MNERAPRINGRHSHNSYEEVKGDNRTVRHLVYLVGSWRERGGGDASFMAQCMRLGIGPQPIHVSGIQQKWDAVTRKAAMQVDSVV